MKMVSSARSCRGVYMHLRSPDLSPRIQGCRDPAPFVQAARHPASRGLPLPDSTRGRTARAHADRRGAQAVLRRGRGALWGPRPSDTAGLLPARPGPASRTPGSARSQACFGDRRSGRRPLSGVGAALEKIPSAHREGDPIEGDSGGTLSPHQSTSVGRMSTVHAGEGSVPG